MDTGKRLVGRSCPPTGFHVTSEPERIHIRAAVLTRKRHNERSRTLAAEEEHTFQIDEMF